MVKDARYIEPVGWSVVHESFDYNNQVCSCIDTTAMRVKLQTAACSLGSFTKLKRIYVQYRHETLLLSWYWRRLGAA